MFKNGLEDVALFGGSFDPPHFGHKSVVEEALKRLKITKLIVLPTFLNPFKSASHFSPDARLLMTREMFEPFSQVVVDDFEILEGEPTTTFKSVTHFQTMYNVQYLIIGADNLVSIDKWYNFEWLNSKITWVIAKRAGYEVDTSKLRAFKILEVDVDISSTEIREKSVKGIKNMDERVERIVTFLDSKKAEEIEVFNLDEVDYIAKRVVIANAISSKHALALAEQLKVELKPQGEEFLHIDESEDWVVSDLGDILVHIMTTEARQRYSMEEFLAELTAGKFTSPYIL